MDLKPLDALKLWHDVVLDTVRRDVPDLSARQLAILLTVYLEPPPHTVRGLAAKLNVSKPAITRALDTMGQKDLLKRKRDDTDKRNVLVQRTVAGSVYLSEVEADRFVESEDFQVTAPRAPLLRRPEDHAPMDTELLFGETFRVYETEGAWCWGQSAHDDYVGYISADLLQSQNSIATHRVVALRTFIYPEADIKSRPATPLSMNAKLVVTGAAAKFVELEGGGYVVSSHLSKIDTYATDYVAVAEEFLGVPYLWGGRDARGLDCSGLVQMSLERCGIACLRDTDLQEATLGESLADPSDLSGLQRGDLIFWRGHVGIMVDRETLLHANATHMRTVKEPIAEAVRRIDKSDGPVTSVKRLGASG
eukprot:s1_g1042.t1